MSGGVGRRQEVLMGESEDSANRRFRGIKEQT